MYLACLLALSIVVHEVRLQLSRISTQDVPNLSISYVSNLSVRILYFLNSDFSCQLLFQSSHTSQRGRAFLVIDQVAPYIRRLSPLSMSNSRLPSVSSNEGRAESEREYLELPPHLSTSSQLGSQNPRLAIVQRSSSPPYISPYPLIDQNTGQLPPSHILRSNHSPSPGPSSSGHPSSSQSATAVSPPRTMSTFRYLNPIFRQASPSHRPPSDHLPWTVQVLWVAQSQ